jgi:hypothetical protein
MEDLPRSCLFQAFAKQGARYAFEHRPMDQRRRVWLPALAVLVALCLAAPPAVSAQSEDGDSLVVKVERLDTQVRTLTRSLKRTRSVVRRQASRLRSGDGRFAIQATGEGLRLRGPSTSLVLSSTALTLSSGASTFQLAPAATTLAAPLVRFGSGSNCPPVARRGDPVALQPELARGSITGSSTGVFAC